jgi:hypothetical protein
MLCLLGAVASSRHLTQPPAQMERHFQMFHETPESQEIGQKLTRMPGYFL